MVTDLQKTYYPRGKEPFTAVRGVSFRLTAGECFGLLGPNGAGKSTSMNCITGFFPPSAGEVRIFGIDVHRDPKQARLRLGVCSQDNTLDTDFSVFDQMILHASYFNIPDAVSIPRANALLERFGLAGKAREPTEELSGGQQRRVQIARALLSEPDLLILDEPTTGLDPEARRMVWEIVRSFRASGGAILLSTHYMEEAERLCDRVAIIHQGVFLDCNHPRDLIEKHVGTTLVREELKPGIFWERPPNLEDVYLKLTGNRLEGDFE